MSGQSRIDTEASTEPALVCIVDDDESVRAALRNLLISAGLAVAAFDSAEAFLVSPRAAAARCVVLDLRMPGMSGSELFAQLFASAPHVPCIILTAVGEDVRERLLSQGVFAFMTKPFKPAQILSTVRAALARSES